MSAFTTSLTSIHCEPVPNRRDAQRIFGQHIPSEDDGASVSAMVFAAFITGGMFGSFIGTMAMAVAWSTL
jgi:hypothetical protein